MVTTSQLINEMRRRSEQVDAAISFLTDQAVAWAEAENEYRKRKALAILEMREGTVLEREAHAEMKVGGFRFERDKVSALRDAALETLRARRGQLSAVQSIANAVRAEAEFARTGQQGP